MTLEGLRKAAGPFHFCDPREAQKKRRGRSTFVTLEGLKKPQAAARYLSRADPDTILVAYTFSHGMPPALHWVKGSTAIPKSFGFGLTGAATHR